MNPELKRADERRRERCWDPVERWRTIQETIGWAERQGKVRRGTPSARIEQERRIRARIEKLAP